MAGHAGVGWRKAGVGRHLDRGVAETAIDAKPGDMVLVAERHRLLHNRT
jgi:hypothetical protein